MTHPLGHMWPRPRGTAGWGDKDFLRCEWISIPDGNFAPEEVPQGRAEVLVEHGRGHKR